MQVARHRASLWLLVGYVVTLLCGCARGKVEDRVSRSPDGTYEIHLTGQFAPTSNPLVPHRVQALVRKNGQPFADLGTIYDFDWFDPAWDPDFGRQTWTNARVLRIAGKDNSTSRDRVTFVNVEEAVVKYALCQVGDILIALDIAPGENSDARVIGVEKPGLLSIRASAEFADGTRVTGSEDLNPSNTMETINHYVVRLSRRALKFEVHFEKPEMDQPTKAVQR